MTNYKKMFLLIMVMSMALTVFGAITVTSPSSADIMESPDDYATLSFQDPWDMNQQTDLGWFIYDETSQSESNLTNIDFSNGIFSASANTTQPNISIVETGVTGTCFLGKIGRNYKIDADKYTIFAMRMKSTQNKSGVLYWSRNTIYNDMRVSGAFLTKNHWRTYIIDIPGLGSSTVAGVSTGYPWGGDLDSLRFDPARAQIDIDIDWIRLLEDDGSLYRTITWTGNSGNVDIYLDNDTNEGNGTLGVLDSDVSGTSYNFFAGALEPGIKYYIGIKNTSGGSLSYSGGYYRINDIPTLVFTSPSEEGGNDFATVELGNAWDMNAISDLDKTYRVNNGSITNITAENVQGDSLGSISVYKGTSQVASTNAGDPVLYYLLWWGDGRGMDTPIDTSKYRILVIKMGLPGNWDLNKGSVARVVWKLVGEGDNENVTEDIIIRHKNPGKVMNTIIADMNDLPLEPGGASPSHTGWSGMAEGFRLDPHEFPSAYDFYIQEVKLAAFERADDSYTFRWAYTDDYATSSTMSLYRDTNNTGFNGTLIHSGIDPTAESYTWNTSGVAEGTYYIYATYSDGLNTNRAYARWPIVIDHSSAAVPTIALSTSSLSFGTTSTSKTFNVSNSGSGTLSWTVSDNKSWISVSPTSGQGSGTVTVTVNRSGLSAGTYTGTVTVTDSNATNSPQTVNVTMDVAGGSGNGVISLNRDALYFGADKSGTVTGSQTILVENSGSGTMVWSASESASWLSLSGASGTNAGVITVSANASGLGAGTYNTNVTITAGTASNSPYTLPVTLTVYRTGTTDKPVGFYSTPTNGSTVRSSIAVTGWVVDDIEVDSVQIYNGSAYVGEAVFVDGARPDVEADYPGYPKNYLAGWGYMLLTNFLPNGGNGWYDIHAYATDAEGHRVLIGTKRIYCDNNNAVKPFGAIDTPTQGGIASGTTFINWGWALAPQPNSIPTNGSTLSVWVNGVKIGQPTYNLYRADIANRFPGYANTNGAIGKYILNTTAYANGVHNMHWMAEDNAGNKDGIGSRFFTIQNTGGDRLDGTASGTADNATAFQPPRLRLLKELSVFPGDRFASMGVRKGYDSTEPFTEFTTDKTAGINVSLRELQRVVLRLGEKPEKNKSRKNVNTAASKTIQLIQRYEGYLRSGERLKRLPAGSTLDSNKGIFYWQPGPGFVGHYELLFLDKVKNRVKQVNINIEPKY